MLLVFFFTVFMSGLSVQLCFFLQQLTASRSPFLIGPLLLALLNGIFAIVFFPLTFYHSFLLEHQFGLSTQSLKDWFLDQLKAGGISLAISCFCLDIWYVAMRVAGSAWWIWMGCFWIIFTVVLTQLAPVVIIPLFFKYSRCPSESLVARIRSLAGKMRVGLLDVFEINYSAKSLKANAALVGWGSTRRVLLTDTLRQRYTDDEIEVILAHEFAHQRFGHLTKHIVLQSGLIMIFFYAVSAAGQRALAGGAQVPLSDPAAVPLVLSALTVFGLISRPLGNWASRRWERQADALALEATGLRQAFISMMEKLAEQNLSDRHPPPLIKLFFFDHPPVDERIALARRK